MVKIGVTGLIGSGKSTVIKVLGGFGVPVYDSDRRAKEIMQGELLPQISQILGERAVSNGQLNRAYIASQIFGSSELRMRLEALVHPRVETDMREWFEAQKHEPCVAVESAILVESGLARYMDEIIVVSAPREMRIARVMGRDGCSRDQVEARMSTQMSEHQIASHGSWVVVADEKELLIAQLVGFLSKKKINFATTSVVSGLPVGQKC